MYDNFLKHTNIFTQILKENEVFYPTTKYANTTKIGYPATAE